MTIKFTMATALILMICLLIGQLAMAEKLASNAHCRFENDGKTYVNGSCEVKFFGNNAVELVAGRHRIEILADDDTWSSGIAHWNSGHSQKFDYDLGRVTPRAGEDGLCWAGENLEICYEGMDPD